MCPMCIDSGDDRQSVAGIISAHVQTWWQPEYPDAERCLGNDFLSWGSCDTESDNRLSQTRVKYFGGKKLFSVLHLLLTSYSIYIYLFTSNENGLCVMMCFWACSNLFRCVVLSMSDLFWCVLTYSDVFWPDLIDVFWPVLMCSDLF